MASKTVTVPNISCHHCVMNIQRELGGLDGVRTVVADAATKTVTVDWDEKRTGWDSIEELLTEIEYPPAKS